MDDEGNNLSYFEVSNTFLTRRGAVRVIRKNPNVKILKVPKYFSDSDAFCEFELNNKKITVVEPYGDNSRFDIICEEANTQELEQIANTFEAYRFDALSIIRWGFIVIPLGYLFYDIFL